VKSRSEDFLRNNGARIIQATLGDALAYVLQVERILLQRKEIYPGFDDRDGGWQWMEDET
jgi:hypothetical protein